MNLTQLATDIASSYQPPNTGRPSAIGDSQLLQELFDQIEAGNYPETACELAGLHLNTYRNWIKRGEAGETPFNAFLFAVKRASARAEALAVSRVRDAGKDPRFWAAEMTYLERRHPEKWGRRSEGSHGPSVQVYVGGVDIKDVKIAIVNTAPQELSDTFACSTQALSLCETPPTGDCESEN